MVDQSPLYQVCASPQNEQGCRNPKASSGELRPAKTPPLTRFRSEPWGSLSSATQWRVRPNGHMVAFHQQKRTDMYALKNPITLYPAPSTRD